MPRPKGSGRSSPKEATELAPIEEDVIRWIPKPPSEETIRELTGRRKGNNKCRDRSIKTILSQWESILKACQRGYEYPTIANAIGVTAGQFNNFVTEFPEARKQLSQARLYPRDFCLGVVLNAARRGDWLPAAWYLERKHWQEFAKPEVSLQLLDRAESQNEVVQTFGGKPLSQINQELREQYHGNPDFRRALEQITAEGNEIVSRLGADEGQDDRPENRPDKLD